MTHYPRLALLALAAASRLPAADLSILVDYEDHTAWASGNLTFSSHVFTFGTESMFGAGLNGLTLYYFVDDRAVQAMRAYASIMPSSHPSFEFTSSFLRAGSTVDATTSFLGNGNNAEFCSLSLLNHGAVSGRDNFLGFRVQDVGGNWHYGQMQFQLGTVSQSPTVAINFLGGVVSSVAGSGITAMAVPEPSTYGLALGGLALAVVAVRRRRSAR